MTCRHRSGAAALRLIAAAGFVGFAAAPALAAAEAAAGVTYAKEIAPILQRSCETCHRQGGVAPMSLTTYDEVRPWARAIRQKTATREMPPWFIEKEIGVQRFKNDPSLSDTEIAMVADWVDAGAPMGDPADLPPAREYADAAEWTIGEPDLIVSSPVVTVAAVAPDYHREIGPTPTGLTEDRYIKAVEVKETRLEGEFKRVAGTSDGDMNYFTLHHAGIRELGFDMDQPDGFYLIYELGQNATVYPKNTGVLLKADSALTYTVHMHSIGVETPVRVDVGFVFHPKGFEPQYSQSGYNAGLVGGSQVREDLIMPAGQDDIRFDSIQTMTQNGVLTTFEPHMHMSGKRMCVEAQYPNGHREVLNCAGYNHNWVKTYVYEDDVAPLLPKGTILHITGWYNNSRSNPRNVEPRNWKTGGNRSIDEMFVFLPKITLLSDEQFAEEVVRREALHAGAAANQQN